MKKYEAPQAQVVSFDNDYVVASPKDDSSTAKTRSYEVEAADK